RAGPKIRRYARERPAHCHFIARLKRPFQPHRIALESASDCRMANDSTTMRSTAQARFGIDQRGFARIKMKNDCCGWRPIFRWRNRDSSWSADFGVGNLVGNFPGCRAFEIQRATENGARSDESAHRRCQSAAMDSE